MSAERIVAAAVSVDGVTFTGPHHHQILRYLHAMGVRGGRGEQGFITSANRFVGRREAAGLAIAAGQEREHPLDPDCLFSEQLWEVPDRVFMGEAPAVPRKISYGIVE